MITIRKVVLELKNPTKLDWIIEKVHNLNYTNISVSLFIISFLLLFMSGKKSLYFLYVLIKFTKHKGYHKNFWIMLLKYVTEKHSK